MSAGGSAGGDEGGRPGADGRRRSPPWIVLWVLVPLAVLAALRAGHHVQHDSSFCASSCHHERDLSRLEAHGHKGMACQECHATTLRAGLGLLAKAIVRSRTPAKHGQVTAATCGSCHERRPAEWRVVGATQGHREHASAKGVDCLSCHAKTAHKPEGAEQACIACHSEQRLHKATTAGAETCLSCHSFASSAALASQPTPVACDRCHGDRATLTASAGASPVRDMKDVNAHVLHGGVACQLCHNPHGKKPKAPPGQPVCVSCHQFQMFRAGTEDRKPVEGHADCENCHEQHLPKKTAQSACIGCHEDNAKGITRAGAGTTTALKHENCASCHVPHSWRAERSGCVQCHADKAALILNRSPPQHGQCTNCHAIHGAPPTGAVCLSCHGKTKGNHVARAPERHKDCTSCHNPHAPRPEDTRTACAKCHKDELSAITHDGPEGHARRSCVGCHTPHENPLPPPTLCAKCHGPRAAVVSKAGPPQHRVCLSCHKQHQFTIKEPILACQKCHSAVLSSTNPPTAHQSGECTKCHTVHGSPGVPKAACLQCHGTVAAQFKPPNATHAECRSCHKPHRAAQTAIAQCMGCHEDQGRVAPRWPPSSPHAKACSGCHQQHNVRSRKACSECHAKEAASAAGGKHECVQCHPPHRAPSGFGAAWWSRCNECHSLKVESVKERGPKHSECKNCHQPHRFSPPTCASCHNVAGKGLHATEQHAAKCTSCHNPHVKAEPTAQQCYSCHADRRDHEPNGKCASCHRFK